MTKLINRSRFGDLAIHGGPPAIHALSPLGKNYENIGAEEIEQALEVLRSKSLFRYYGPDLKHRCGELEQNVAEYLNAGCVLGVTSGTAALRCALHAVGVGDGDEVLAPSFTFIATINAIVVNGAKPVFLPIDHSLNIAPDGLEGFISNRTKAILVAHLENQAADIERIRQFANKHNLYLIEDACQAFGVTFKGQKVGTFGHVGCFSAQQEKNISAGEGGLLVSNHRALYDRALRYHDQGGTLFTQKGFRGGSLGVVNDLCGENFRMPELTAAILIAQLEKVDALLEQQRENYNQITESIVGLFPYLKLREIPNGCDNGGSSFVLFTKSADGVDRVVQALRFEGLNVRRFCSGTPVYQYASLRQWLDSVEPYQAMPCARLDESEKIGARAIIISVGAAFDHAYCESIVFAISKVLRAYRGMF